MAPRSHGPDSKGNEMPTIENLASLSFSQAHSDSPNWTDEMPSAEAASLINQSVARIIEVAGDALSAMCDAWMPLTHPTCAIAVEALMCSAEISHAVAIGALDSGDNEWRRDVFASAACELRNASHCAKCAPGHVRHMRSLD